MISFGWLCLFSFKVRSHILLPADMIFIVVMERLLEMMSFICFSSLRRRRRIIVSNSWLLSPSHNWVLHAWILRMITVKSFIWSVVTRLIGTVLMIIWAEVVKRIVVLWICWKSVSITPLRAWLVIYEDGVVHFESGCAILRVKTISYLKSLRNVKTFCDAFGRSLVYLWGWINYSFTYLFFLNFSLGLYRLRFP